MNRAILLSCSFLTFPVQITQVCTADEQRPGEVPPAAVAVSIGLPGDPLTENLQAWTSGNDLYVLPRELRDDGTVHVPRLSNVVKTITVAGPAEVPWTVHPEPEHWILKQADSPASGEGSPAGRTPPLLKLSLDAAVTVFDPDRVTRADDSGTVFLPAKAAVTHGELLRFEPQPQKNTVGYWANAADFAEWRIALTAAGEYEVDILQGCGKSHGGSDVVLQIQEQELPFVVTETGHFQNFIWRTLGTIRLEPSDRITVKLSATQKSGGAVMDVRAIRIVPHGLKRSTDPELADPDSLPAGLTPIQ
jgi:hypothetical protein